MTAYVVMYFDKKTNRIGFSFTSDRDESGINNLVKIGESSLVTAKAFLKNFGIKHNKTTKYNLEFDEKEGLYVAKL